MLPSGRSMTWRKVFERQWAPRRGGGGAAGRSPVRAALQGWRGSPRRGRSAAMGGLHRVVGIDRARGKWES